MGRYTGDGIPEISGLEVILKAEDRIMNARCIYYWGYHLQQRGTQTPQVRVSVRRMWEKTKEGIVMLISSFQRRAATAEE